MIFGRNPCYLIYLIYITYIDGLNHGMNSNEVQYKQSIVLAESIEIVVQEWFSGGQWFSMNYISHRSIVSCEDHTRVIELYH